MLRLKPGGERPLPIGNWTFPALAPFVESTAYRRLYRELRSYVQQESAGRSFLIAGHRGSGKTTTVTRAIQKLSIDLLRQSINPDAHEIGQRAPLQRPLLVKLVGHSLIAKPPKLREPAAPPADPANPEAAGGAPGTPANEPVPGPDGDDRARDEKATAQGALVHLTIALYRALAAELSRAFAVHALDGDERSRADRLEMAAQLALQLDSNPNPKDLRAYWQRIGRLGAGVLWPAQTDGTFEKLYVFDQGNREIVAAATAAQAYQVCSGQVVYTLTRKDSAGIETNVEAKADLKETLSRLATIGASVIAGGVTGAATAAPAGVAAGVLVWLLGTVSLSWSTKRQRKGEESVDYQFMSDRSLETLDRDLPVVIERIRHAGLAPVFVIDELDKLENVDETIETIIKRLKHLVSDHGFFCFLTDRDYYDRIEQTTAAKAYPREHTYFSDRLLVLNRPDELFDYLTTLIVAEPEA
jgi:Cdc6-like AAA superfamily ATPase